MIPKSILLCFSFALFKVPFNSAFETDQCDHKKITEAIGKLTECLDKEDGDEVNDEDICSPFRSGGECVKTNLRECFSENDVKRIAKETVADLRKTTRHVLNSKIGKYLGILLSEEDIQKMNSLIAACPNMPEQSFSENLKATAFYALDIAVRTDMNCATDQIAKFNVDIGECHKEEVDNAIPQLSRRIQSGGNLLQNICSVLSETAGTCLRKPLPECFSERESVFLKASMIEDGINGLREVIKQLGANGTISVSGCEVFLNENVFPESESQSNFQSNSQSNSKPNSQPSIRSNSQSNLDSRIVFPLSALFYIAAVLAFSE